MPPRNQRSSKHDPTLSRDPKPPALVGVGIFFPIPEPGECFLGTRSKLAFQLTWLQRVTPAKIQYMRASIQSKAIACRDQNQEYGCELIHESDRGYRLKMSCPSTCPDGHVFDRRFATDATALDLLDAVEDGDWELAQHLLTCHAKEDERTKSHLCPPVKGFYCRLRKHMKDESMAYNNSRKLCHTGAVICPHGDPCLYNGGVNKHGIMNLPYWVEGRHVSWIPVRMDWDAVQKAHSQLASGLPESFQLAGVEENALNPADPTRIRLVFQPPIDCWPFHTRKWSILCLLPHSFPDTAPILSFIGMIPWHPNICQRTGLVSPAMVNAIWIASFSMNDILLELPDILENPNKSMNLNPSAAQILSISEAQFRDTASAKIRKDLVGYKQGHHSRDNGPSPVLLVESKTSQLSRTLSLPGSPPEISINQMPPQENHGSGFCSPRAPRTRRRSFSPNRPGARSNMKLMQSMGRLTEGYHSNGSTAGRKSEVIDLTSEGNDIRAKTRPYRPKFPSPMLPKIPLAQRSDSFINDGSDLGYLTSDELYPKVAEMPDDVTQARRRNAFLKKTTAVQDCESDADSSYEKAIQPKRRKPNTSRRETAVSG